MITTYRNFLINFCVMATAEIHGILAIEIDRSEFERLSDDELEREAEWLDDLLNK